MLAGAALLVTGVLLGRPPAARGDAAPATAQELLARAAASATVAFTGTATSSGGLGLPDLPRLGDVAALAGESTRTRTWWSDESTWRTDVLTSTGEDGLYASDGSATAWDYEREAVTVGAPVAGARLPRAADLLPPALARSLLAGSDVAVGSDGADVGRTELLGARVVAGRTVDGVRLRPIDATQAALTTLDHADLWLDRATGLPLAVDVVDVVGGPVLSSAFDAVTLGAPDPVALRVPDPPGASVRSAAADLAASAGADAPWLLPEELAGLPALQDPRTSGVVAYGTGLVRIAVVPLQTRQGYQALRAAEASGAVPLDPAPGAGADAGLVRAGALTGAVLVSRGQSFLLSGAVEPSLLARAAAELVADPPGRRS